MCRHGREKRSASEREDVGREKRTRTELRFDESTPPELQFHVYEDVDSILVRPNLVAPP
jgi:hypothetical protein